MARTLPSGRRPLARRILLATFPVVAILALVAGRVTAWQEEDDSLDLGRPSETTSEVGQPSDPASRPPVTPHDDSPDRPVVRIWNLTDKPFRYQFHQYEGATWTQVYTLPPDRYHQFNIRRPVRKSVIGNRLKGPGGLIQYQAYGGMLKFRGSAWVDSNAAGGSEYEPNFFYIEDSDGNGHIVQGKREKALEEQRRKMAEPHKTPQQIEAIRLQLRANHCWLPLGAET